MGLNLSTKVKIATTGGKRVHAELITPELLANVIARRRSPAGMGKFVHGIPGTTPEHEVRSITILDTKTGRVATAATDATGNLLSGELVRFSQQSMSKPVAEALAKQLIGVGAFKDQVGSDASGKPYNDPATYPDRLGVPYNGNVNIGALKVWDILVTEAGKTGVDPTLMYMEFLKKLANNDALEINQAMANGEFNHTPSTNRALLAELQAHGTLVNNPETVYKAYCTACAVMVTTEDAARIRAAFETGENPATGEVLMRRDVAEHTKRSMTVSGMYDESGTDHTNFGVVGAKSGVDGGIMFGLPSKIAGNPDLIVAVHHAGLNPRGNSAEGTKWMKDLSRMTLISPDDPLLMKPKAIAKGAYKGVKGLFSRASTQKPVTTPVVKSQADIDRELRDKMTEGGPARLESAIQARLENAYQQRLAKADVEEPLANALRRPNETYKGGMYLKPLRRDKAFPTGEAVLSEPDRDGTMLHYYHVPDRHHLEKVVVARDLPAPPPEQIASQNA